MKKRIENILHPAIIAEMGKQWERSIAENPDRIVIFDIPLLFEVNLQHRFDFIIVVYTSRNVQRERLAHREKISLEEAERLINLQLDIEFKKANASAVIMNNGNIENTARQVDALWLQLTDLWRSFSKSPAVSQSLPDCGDSSSSPPSKTF